MAMEKALEKGNDIDEIEFEALREDVLDELAITGMASLDEKLGQPDVGHLKMQIAMAGLIMLLFVVGACACIWRVMLKQMKGPEE